jgi:hypothetical protein
MGLLVLMIFGGPVNGGIYGRPKRFHTALPVTRPKKIEIVADDCLLSFFVKSDNSALNII